MQGLVRFASEIGYVLAVLLPTFAYLAALALFMFAGWAFWMQARPENPFRGRPWVPVVSLLLCGAFASFDRVLTMANASGGSTIEITVGALTAYVPPGDPGNILGGTPGATVVNVIELFQGFFQAFGAMAAFFSVLSWRSVINGQSKRSQGGCGVQFVFGVMLINILTITEWLVGVFET
jgi:hypothetical protein